VIQRWIKERIPVENGYLIGSQFFPLSLWWDLPIRQGPLEICEMELSRIRPEEMLEESARYEPVTLVYGVEENLRRFLETEERWERGDACHRVVKGLELLGYSGPLLEGWRDTVAYFDGVLERRAARIQKQRTTPEPSQLSMF
tara:strand:- start:30 stop:458 length:429 start_codon:yes stop_codon:yes gene_type:complete